MAAVGRRYRARPGGACEDLEQKRAHKPAQAACASTITANHSDERQTMNFMHGFGGTRAVSMRAGALFLAPDRGAENMRRGGP